jgi:hypothetical protein
MIQRADILQTRGAADANHQRENRRGLPLPGLDKNRKQRSNELHYFSGATLQGKKAPAGFLPGRDFSSQKARCL